MSIYEKFINKVVQTTILHHAPLRSLCVRLALGCFVLMLTPVIGCALMLCSLSHGFITWVIHTGITSEQVIARKVPTWRI